MLHWSLRLLSSLLILPAAVWGLLALHFQLPFNQAQNTFIQLTWAGLSFYALYLLWRGYWKTGVLLYLVLHGELLLWWNDIPPLHAREWSAECAQMTPGYVSGSSVPLHKVRNIRCRSASD